MYCISLWEMAVFLLSHLLTSQEHCCRMAQECVIWQRWVYDTLWGFQGNSLQSGGHVTGRQCCPTSEQNSHLCLWGYPDGRREHFMVFLSPAEQEGSFHSCTLIWMAWSYMIEEFLILAPTFCMKGRNSAPGYQWAQVTYSFNHRDKEKWFYSWDA